MTRGNRGPKQMEGWTSKQSQAKRKATEVKTGTIPEDEKSEGE